MVHLGGGLRLLLQLLLLLLLHLLLILLFLLVPLLPLLLLTWRGGKGAGMPCSSGGPGYLGAQPPIQAPGPWTVGC